MRDSFYAAIRVVTPLMMLMLIGWCSRVRQWIDRPAMKEYDRLIFKVFMPVLLFKNIYDMDASQGLAWKELIFVAVCLLINFAFSMTFPKLLTKDGRKYSVLGQATVRGNYVLFGVAVAEALYGEGNTRMVVMLGVLVIPAINIFSAIILEAGRSKQANILQLFLAIFKNPMIMGAIAGFIAKGLGIVLPAPVWYVVRTIANSTTTISFISLGVGLDMASAFSDKRLLLWGVFLRMVLVPGVFMPMSVMAGFRGESLCAMMVVFAAPSAVASYPMAVAMGADGQLAGQLVCITTILSVFTIFMWTFVLHAMGWM